MQIISEPREMQRLCASWRCGRETIGFVPTMGALHAGHLELARRAKRENQRMITSIFVNPAQFGPREDLERYPQPFERDTQQLADLGCDAVFAPTKDTMYGAADFLHGTWVDVTPFDEMWEGVTRPGHLRGVATIVTKLFNICSPTRAYFGEKDFQQLRVVESLVRDLNFGVKIVPCETVREPDGLAMSSRNAYLSPEERKSATVIFRAMKAGKALAQSGETSVAKIGAAMDEVFAQEPALQQQYVTIVDAETLTPLRELDGQSARILVAAHLGKTRLIDNLAL
ncbi:pantothenate synthetase [Abditibacteriota bacterium]|nr:pantothenate synthetase [Abditibacteriota bacterium]